MIRFQVSRLALGSFLFLGILPFGSSLESLSRTSPFGPQSQDLGESPADIVVQAMRVVESGDTAALAAWFTELSGSVGEGEAMLARSTAAWLTYEFDEARDLLSAVLETGSHPPPLVPFAWILRGEIAATTGDFQGAEDAFSRALENARNLEDPRGEAWSLIRLAAVRGRLSGDPSVLQDLLGQAEPLIEADDPFLLGQFHCARAGNDPQGRATPEGDAARGAELALTAGVRRLHAACLHVRAATELRAGQTAAALNTFWEEQQEQEAIGDRAGRAATLQWAGFVLFTLGDYGASRAYLLEAVADGQASGNLSPVAWAYMSLSGIALGVGDVVAAREYLERAEELLTRQGDRLGLATLTGRKAAVAFAAGAVGEAKGLWREARGYHETARDPVGSLGALTGLLEAAIYEGRIDEAETLLAEARDLAEGAGMGSWVVAFLFHEAEIALLKGELDRARDALTAFLAPGQFSIRMYRAQARYAEILARQGRSAEAGEVLATALDTLEEWREDLDALQLQSYAFQVGEYLPDPDLGVATVIAALAEAGHVNQAFDLAERQRARHLYEQMLRAEVARVRGVEAPDAAKEVSGPAAPLNARSVIEAVPDDHTALIQYVTGTRGEPTTVFTITGRDLAADLAPPVDSLRRDVDLLLSMVRSGADPSTTARRLGSHILAPSIRRLPPEISRLVVVPDGVLHRLPFDLLDPDGTGPLVRRFAVSTVPSATILASLLAQETVDDGSLLAFADPHFQSKDEYEPETGEDGPAADQGERGPPVEPDDLLPLPGALREVRAIARYGDPSESRTGLEATEEFLRSTPPGKYSVFHFATHALVDESTPARTALMLSPGGGEDGLVSPGEIARLNLDASLIVLSACRTGGGTVVRGEGIQGLTGPLLEAGARSLVATQWPIEDRSGLRLIEGFYRELALGSTVSEAMRSAKLESMERSDPPSIWAAYTVVGNPDVIIPLTLPRSKRALLVLLVVAVIGGVSVLVRRWRSVRGPA